MFLVKSFVLFYFILLYLIEIITDSSFKEVGGDSVIPGKAFFDALMSAFSNLLDNDFNLISII